jgi:UDP-3-O-[3-hydroxymyristoyl] glucosamine N-acyltransferase
VSGEFRLGELAERLGGRVVGDPRSIIRGVATLDQAGPDEISFLVNPRYLKAAHATRAGAVLLKPDVALEGPSRLEIEEPYLALVAILELFHPAERRPPEISPEAHLGRDVEIGDEVTVGPFAVVDDGVRLGDRVTVEAGCFVGRGCRIEEDSTLMPRVVLYPGTRVGKRCLIHSGVVLGGDGFGFATSKGRHHKVPQLGQVSVEDDVELGANTTVDRGTLGKTIIGAGSKLDNLVMIAHGATIGRDCLFAAQSGIAGSTRLGSQVTFAGQSGAAGHLSIADGTIVAAKSAVFADIPRGQFVAGIPAVDHQRWKRAQMLIKRLPELRRELREMKRRLGVLEGQTKEED